MIAFILVSIVLLLIAWLMRRHAQHQIGKSLSGRILYTDTEANREILTSDRYSLSGKPDYILEEHGELIPVERKSRAVNSRGAYDSERLQLAAYVSWSKNALVNPCAAAGCSTQRLTRYPLRRGTARGTPLAPARDPTTPYDP
jgi:hypothetical protein